MVKEDIWLVHRGICPKCEDDLIHIDDGILYCENCDLTYILIANDEGDVVDVKTVSKLEEGSSDGLQV